MKTKRFVLSRKKWTEEEANTQIQNYFQCISTHTDNIHYWMQKKGKELDFIDVFILGTDGLKTPEEFIEMSQKEVTYLSRKIYEDFGRYVVVKNTCG